MQMVNNCWQWITIIIIIAACHRVNGQIGTDSTPPLQQQKQLTPQNHAHMENTQPSQNQQQKQTPKDNVEKVCVVNVYKLSIGEICVANFKAPL